VTEGGVAVIRSAVAALNGGDIDGYLGYMDPGCERWLVGVDRPLSRADVRGGLIQLWAAFDAVHLDEVLLFGDGVHVCARWRMRGVHTGEFFGVAPTGRSIDVEQCEVYELGIDGLVTASWVYGDHGLLFRQVGAEEKGSP
jgi:predicted ester cyclase